MNTAILHKIFARCALLSSAFVFHISSFAQINKIDEITSGYNDYIKNHLTEKIFVHTDRSYYLCGNIMWFKIYANDADNQLFSVSKVAYIEMLNTMHQPVLQGKIAIENGTGSGLFELPASLASGTYELRAYTNWMKNNSPDYYFKKIVTIINTSQNLDTSLAHRNTKYAAQFFPEGGNLVNELNSTIAFKVNDSYGKGVDCDGLIIDQSKDTITHFQSSRFGMGKFSFTPQTGKNYTAVIRLNDSSIITKALPNAYGNGYVMHVSDLDARHIKISVQSSSGMPLSNVYIIAETRQHIDFEKQFR